MNRFFEFSTAQLRVIVLLTALLMVLSLFKLIRSYSTIDEQSLRFSVQLGDTDSRYKPPIIVDLNRSPADSLELLPYIGPVIASRIVASRDSARFEKVEDIVRVQGISYKKFNEIKGYLKVEPW
jgi:DNA uptake protein ComE-like DNA-binding protein